MENISATEITSFLKGIDFPASKQDLINKAEENDAPYEFIDFIDNLPDKQYTNMVDIEYEASQII